MKTDPCARPKRRAPPRLTGSFPSWRMYLTTSLASLYVLAWGTFVTSLRDASAASAQTQVARVPARAVAGSEPGALWIDELPVAARPRVVLPAGWALASREPGRGQPAVTRVARARPIRIRTRSS